MSRELKIDANRKLIYHHKIGEVQFGVDDERFEDIDIVVHNTDSVRKARKIVREFLKWIDAKATLG